VFDLIIFFNLIPMPCKWVS